MVYCNRMKVRKIICACLALVAWSQVVTSGVAQTPARLKTLFDNKQYFELRDELESRELDQSASLLFYRGVVGNKFGQHRASINFLSRYLKNKQPRDSDFLTTSYELLADNYVKLYQYEKAAQVYNVLLANSRNKLDAKKIADVENVAKLWGALHNVPPQSVSHPRASTIKTSKNALGLTELPVEINGREHAFIFDTGANLSLASLSFAREADLKIVDTAILVGSITGDKVPSKLGIAPRLKIGNATIRNAVFLVFDDKDLFVAGAEYQIKAVLGFPVIQALKEITFHKSDLLSIPATPGKGGEKNLALDGLTPLLIGTFRGRRMTFRFDSGANTTDLYPPFFKAYEEEIKARYSPRSESVSGAGGSKRIAAYRVRDIEMTFSGRTARFPEVTLLTEPTVDGSRYFYGNLGHDLIGQFERTTINFRAMSVVFE
jgi:hypothetical protein